MLKVLRDKRLAFIPSVSAALLVLLTGAFLAPGFGLRVENFVYDLAMRRSDVQPTPTIAIVAVDPESTRRLGAWPWPRSVHAQLLNKLSDAGARTIAFAFPMSESQNNAGLEQVRAALNLLQSTNSDDSAQTEQLKKLLGSSVADLDEDGALAEAIAHHGNVILPIEADLAETSPEPTTAAISDQEQAHATASNEALKAAPAATHIHLPASRLTTAARGLAHLVLLPDEDQVVRTDIAAIRDGDKLIPSLALALGASQQGVDTKKIRFSDEASADFGERRLELSDGFRWRGILFPATGTRAIARYSYWQILAGNIPADQLRGKTIVVGLTAESTNSAMTTPQKEMRAAAGVVASFAASLANERTFHRPLWGIALQWLLSAGVLALAIWLLPQLGMLLAIGITLVLSSALVFMEIGILNLSGAWLQLTLPAMALFAAAMGSGFARATFKLATPHSRGNDPVGSLRTLGLTFQGQGQLDLAYETFRRCPADKESLELIYGLGLDYERRRQFGKAAEVYGYIASVDAGFKDVQPRRERMKRSEIALNAATKTSSKTGGAAKSAAVTPLRPAPATAAKAATSKQSLGRYEIERELGKGAMGVVYLGRDPKINRVVAIKAIALAEEFAEDDLADARARFFREAEMAGRLNHPGIVTVYDAGEDRGLAYIAMEYLRGEHLSHYSEPIHLLPVAKVLALMARVADALDYAHKQNVVHRDIKPANIMFNADTDELKITDFGIARLTDTSRTKTGIVLGTPSFMSPEQLEGRPLDGRSDLFALGIALYQLLTGQLPFRADSMTRLMHKIAIEPHVPLLSLRPELPEMAEQIVARALAKSAQDRYQTGAEMAVALRGCIRLVARKDALAR